MSHGAHNTKVELASASNESRAFVSLSTAFVPFLFKDEEVEVEAAATNWRQPRVNDCELSILLWVVGLHVIERKGSRGAAVLGQTFPTWGNNQKARQEIQEREVKIYAWSD